MKIREMIRRMLKPIMNQRGKAGDSSPNPNLNPDPLTVETPVDEFIPGTTFKTPEELTKGYLNLKEKFDSQGNELGTIRKDHESLKSQTETLANILKEQLGKENKEPITKTPIDYEGELANVEQEILKLDPMAPDYQKTLAVLVTKSTKLAAMDQHLKTMTAAGEMMKKELTARDSKASQDSFYRLNPEFKTPEMQIRIKEFINNDTTGLHDPMSAFFQIQRDDIISKAEVIRQENEEYKRLIDLNRGKSDAGIVVVKGQSGPGSPPIKQPKATGKDLDIGMAAVLAASKENA
jgi:hypothetical protein